STRRARRGNEELRGCPAAISLRVLDLAPGATVDYRVGPRDAQNGVLRAGRYARRGRAGLAPQDDALTAGVGPAHVFAARFAGLDLGGRLYRGRERDGGGRRGRRGGDRTLAEPTDDRPGPAEQGEGDDHCRDGDAEDGAEGPEGTSLTALVAQQEGSAAPLAVTGVRGIARPAPWAPRVRSHPVPPPA